MVCLKPKYPYEIVKSFCNGSVLLIKNSSVLDNEFCISISLVDLKQKKSSGSYL